MRRSIVVATAVLALGLGALVRPASAEVLTKPDGTRFDIAPGTKATPADNNVVKLESGAIRARMPEDGRKTVRPRVVTEAATVMVMEGDALVSVDDAKTTRVSVHRGGASITVRGRTTEVPDGFGIQIAKGAAATKAKPLPVAPVWSAPAKKTFVVGNPTADVTLPFEPSSVAGTPPTGWHLQVAKDIAFADVVVDTQAPLVARSFEAKGLAAGTYHARASATDVDGFEGKWSTSATVNVVRVNVERISAGRVRLSVEPASAKCTVDGATTTFPTDADQHQTHDVVCGEGPGAKLVIGARPLEGVRLTTTATATGPQTGSLKVAVVDVEGQPVDRLKPVVMTPSDLAVAPLVATGAPGEYVATYTFTGPPHAVPISIKLRNDWTADAGTVNFASWAFAPGQPGAGASKDSPNGETNERKGGLEIGAAGLAAYRGKPPVGVGVEGELRGAFAVPHGVLFIGAAGGYTQLLETTLDGRSVEGWNASMRLLVGYRLGTGVVAPYVTLGPEVLRQIVELPVAGRKGREWLVGASGGLGLDVEAGPGAFFVEVRGRLVAPAEEDTPALTASGVLGLLGYRLRL
jgi:hypothetical protein